MEYKLRFNKKRLVMYFLFFIVFLFATYLLTDFKEFFYQGRGIPCIEYLEEGTLYEGQPRCEQGPVSYWVGLILVKLAGYENLQITSMIFVIIMNILVLDLIFRILKTRRIQNILLIFLLYLLTIFPTTWGHMPTLIAMYFILAATYLIFETKAKNRFYYSSVLFGLAILSKFTAIILFVTIVLVYGIYSLKISSGKLKIKKELIGKVLQLIIPAGIVLFIAKFIYPNVYIYSGLSHAYNPQLSIPQTIIKFLTTNPFNDIKYLFFILFSLLALVIFIKTWDKYALIYLLSNSLIMFRLTLQWDHISNLFGLRYLLVPWAFFILAFFKPYFNIRKVPLKFFIMFLLVALLFYNHDSIHLEGKPSLRRYVSQYNPLLKQLKAERDKVQEKIEEPFSFIPRNERHVLVNEEMYQTLRKRNKDMNFELVENRNNPPGLKKYLDPGYVPGLQAYGVLKSTDLGVNVEEIKLAEEIKSGKYEMIFIGPDERDSMVFYALQIAGQDTINKYCVVYLPTMDRDIFGRHRNTLLYDNISYCRNLVEQSINYYVNIFDEVCQKDQYAAEYFIKQIFSLNNILINGSCTSGKEFIKYYDTETRLTKTHPVDFFVWPIVMLIIILLLWRGHQKKKK